MDYNKLKEKIISSYGQIQIFFDREGESIKFSEGGFYQAVRNDSLKVGKLEKISEKLNVPMAYWWDDSEKGKVDDFHQNYGRELVRVLENSIEEYKQTIKELKIEKHKLSVENDEMKVKLGYSKASGYE